MPVFECVTCPQDVYEPEMQRIVPYMFCIGLIGIFTLVLLRKRFIIDYRLPFPSGTATGVLISSFHTPKGAAAATEQVRALSASLPDSELAVFGMFSLQCWRGRTSGRIGTEILIPCCTCRMLSTAAACPLQPGGAHGQGSVP